MDSKRDKLRRSIIDEIKRKDSLWAEVAKRSIENDEHEEQYMIILYEQSHIDSFQEFLGKELFNDLIRYNYEYNNKQILTFTK